MELEFARWLTERFGTVSDPTVRVGIGDDAAVLRLNEDQDLVVTTDLLLDGIHFRLAEVGPRLVGRKSLAANLSDLAAMGAEPWGAFVSLALPREHARSLAVELYEGMAALAQSYECPLLGGDTNCWPGPMAINLCVLGKCPTGQAWLRSGARPGDLVVVTGPLGGSILGKHLHFEPRLAIARSLRRTHAVHAACDISDGLALDLWRMCQASQCGAILEAERIPVAADAYQLARQSGRLPLEHALADGEDFELIVAIASDAHDRLVKDPDLANQLYVIGQFCAHPGLWLVEHGVRSPLSPVGYQHGTR